MSVTPSAKAIARLHQTGRVRTAAAREVPPRNFVDLCAFLLAWDAYRTAVGDDEHYEKANALMRRLQPQVSEGIRTYFGPVIEDKLQTFRPEYKLAVKDIKGVSQAITQAEFLREFLPFLRSRAKEMSEIFPQKSLTTVKRVAMAASEDSPEAVLHGLATTPAASSLRMLHQWVLGAAKRAGVEPSELEQTLADATSAKQLGEELHQIESQLDKLDPTSIEAVELQSQKQELYSLIEEISEDSANPQVVLATVASVVSEPREYATATGKVRKLNPDKEAAMMIRGKGVIAAGAGAGKTMTLASKVVYHINELGVPANSVMATSFSRKSAAELRRRIDKYGASIDKRADSGFGTTHAVANALTNRYGRGQGRQGLKDYEQSSLVRLAVEQIQMGSTGAFGAPPPATSLFSGDSGVPEEAPPLEALTFKAACEAAFQNRSVMKSSFLRGFIESYFNPRDKWYRQTMQKTRNLTDPHGLTGKQWDIITQIFSYTNVDYDLDLDPNLKGGTSKMGARKKDKDKSLREEYEFFSRPGRQWFNLGLKLKDEDDEEPVQLGDFKSAITKYKGRLVSPSEAWHQAKEGNGVPAEAAAYAAYEWLKSPRGEASFQGKGDFDDVLIDASKMMLSNPKALRQIQSRFKVVLVDEAQDLNRAQHMMFGLITGYLDPAKAAQVGGAGKMSEMANDDGSMTADTYVFIGDDKQAIYEFRSADPEAFIDMSDLVEGGAGFKTHVLETNYRSGKLIVEAANRLIAFNTKQIPMACKANPEREDEGGVETISFPPNGTEEAATWVAEKILSEMGEGFTEGDDARSYDNYGMALRSNAEAYTYGIELLKRGIPFRTKVNFFRDKNAKALLHWLTLADEGPNGNVERVNEVVLEARRAPTSMLGKKFESQLKKLATGNYLTWLQDNWHLVYGRHGKYAEYVKHYVDNLTKVAALDSSLDPEELLGEILQLQGYNGENVRDAMADRVWNDKEAMAELRANSSDGKISEAEIEEVAMAPLAPLSGLLGSRASLGEAMKYTRQLSRANEKLAAVDDPDAPGVNEPAVTLGTMHSWKGLEVPQIFIPMVGGRFPRADSDKDALASERRLAYVAITRGEDQVTVLDIPTTRKEGKRTVTLRSQFVSEMCVPPTLVAPDGKKAAASVAFPPGVSPQDEDMMDAYLRGDDPMKGAEQEVDPLDDAWGDTLYEERG